MEIECSMLVHEKRIVCHFSGIFVDKPFAYHIDIYRKLPKQYNNSKGLLLTAFKEYS